MMMMLDNPMPKMHSPPPPLVSINPLNASINNNNNNGNSNVLIKPQRKKVHVVYYLSRSGQLDHPHLLEGYLPAGQDSLRLRDFKKWLGVLRGKAMPNSFAWSYKRSYKNGFIWHDLSDNDVIQPLCKNEYILMGSEIKGLSNAVPCKCGGTKLGEDGDENMNKFSRSPALVSNASTSPSPASLIIDQSSIDRKLASEIKLKDNTAIRDGSGPLRVINAGPGATKSYELSAQKLLEEINRKATDADSITDTDVGDGTDDKLMVYKKYPKQSLYKPKYNSTNLPRNGLIEHAYENGNDATKYNVLKIADVGTQTGESRRCSTSDRQEMVVINQFYEEDTINQHMIGSPSAASVKSCNGRINGNNANVVNIPSPSSMSNPCRKSSLSLRPKPIPASKNSISNLLDVEKHSLKVKLGSVSSNGGYDNTTSIPSPAISVSSARSSKSTRFNPSLDQMSSSSSNIGHRQCRSSGNYKNGTNQKLNFNCTRSNANTHHQYSLLKQLLYSCSNVDVISERDNVIISHGSLSRSSSTLISPNMSANHKIKSSNYWKCKPGDLMKRITTTASTNYTNFSDVQSTKSGRFSNYNGSDVNFQIGRSSSSVKDVEFAGGISSPESVYHSASGSARRSIKSLIRVNQASNCSPNPSNYSLSRPAGSTSPGMISVCSSTSRRSSIRESDICAADIEEGFREAFKNAMGTSPKTLKKDVKRNKMGTLTNNDHELQNLGASSRRSSTVSVSELHQMICNPPGMMSGAPRMRSSKKPTESRSRSASSEPVRQMLMHKHNVEGGPNGEGTTAREILMQDDIQNDGIVKIQTTLKSTSLKPHQDNIRSKTTLEDAKSSLESTSSLGSSWRDLLWSPRYLSSMKDKDTRRMKP